MKRKGSPKIQTSKVKTSSKKVKTSSKKVKTSSKKVVKTLVKTLVKTSEVHTPIYQRVMKLSDYRRILGICYVTCERLMAPPPLSLSKKRKSAPSAPKEGKSVKKQKAKVRIKMDIFWLKRGKNVASKFAIEGEGEYHFFEMVCTEKEGKEKQGAKMKLIRRHSTDVNNSLKNYEISSDKYSNANKDQLARFWYSILHNYITTKLNATKIKELKYF